MKQKSLIFQYLKSILVLSLFTVSIDGFAAPKPKVTLDPVFDCEAALLADRVNKQFASSVLNSSKQVVVKHVNDLAQQWSRALQTEVRRTRTDGTTEREIQRKVARLQAEIREAQIKFKDAILELYKKYVIETETKLIDSNYKEDISWDEVNKLGWGLAAAFADFLKQKYPIDNAIDTGITAAERAHNLSESILETRILLERSQVDPATLYSKTKFGPDGSYVLELPRMGIRIFVDRQLKTTVIHPHDGLILEDQNFVVSLDGGAGTVNSHAGGWKHLIPNFVSNGMSPIAIDPPWSGYKLSESASPYLNLEQTLQFLHKRDRWVQSLVKGKTDGGWVPHEIIGRSLGAQLAVSHAIFNNPPEGDVAAFIATAFSNPITFDYQIEGLMEQERKGVVQGLSMPSLMNGKLLSLEMLARLDQMKRQDPEALHQLGDNILFIQGDADLDSGPEAEKYLRDFVEAYMPKAHVFMINNPLVGQVDFYELPEEKTEGSHFLYSNHDELKDQMIQINALKYAFRDYLADRSTKLAAYRTKKIGEMKWLDWYWQNIVLKSKSNRKKIKEKDFRKADPTGRSIPSRVKKVEEFFKAEALRVHGVK